MKKIYMTPSQKVHLLSIQHKMMSMSQGEDEENGVAEVREEYSFDEPMISSSNVWDEEW